MVTVNLFATYRLEAGVKSFQLDNPVGMTVANCISTILEKYPVLRKHWIGSEGELFAYVIVIYNGYDIYTQTNGLDTRLHDGDVLGFFPPMAGG